MYHYNKYIMILDALNTPNGMLVVSIILGFGLAGLFRQVCNGPHCVVVKGPGLSSTKQLFKVADECFRYTPIVRECDS